MKQTADRGINRIAGAGLLLALLLCGGCLDDAKDAADGKDAAKSADAAKKDAAKKEGAKAPGADQKGGPAAVPLGPDGKPLKGGIKKAEPSLLDKLLGRGQAQKPNADDKNKKHKNEHKKAAEPKISQKAGKLDDDDERLKLARSMFEYPPLSNADSPELRRLSKDVKTLEADLDRLSQLQRRPDPQAKSWLMHLAETDLNPLAAAATSQLYHYPGEDTTDFVQSRLKSQSPQVRTAALASLVRLDPEEGMDRALDALNDPDAGVRTAAILGLGLLSEPRAAQPLQTVLIKSQPGIGIFAAWALLRCSKAGQAGHDQAIQFLKNLSRSDSPQFAARAVTLLRSERSAEVTALLFDCLYSKWDVVAYAAAETLGRMNASDYDRGLSGFSVERQQAVRNRLALMLYLLNQRPAPADFEGSISSTETSDRELAIRGLEKSRRVADIPVLIVLAGDPVPAIREKAAILLEGIAKAQGMSAGPDDIHDQTGWGRWWLRQYRVLSAVGDRALLQSPAGETRQVTTGTRVAFRARVTRITPGALQDGRTGARVELDFNGQPVVLEP